MSNTPDESVQSEAQDSSSTANSEVEEPTTEPVHFTDWQNIDQDDSASGKSKRILPDGGVPMKRTSNQQRKAAVFDQGAQKYQPSNPPASPARTTWLTTDLDSDAPQQKRQRYNRRHSLQHGRGHTYEGYEGQRVHQQTIDKYLRCDAILQWCEVNDATRSWVLKKLMTDDLRGFNAHYKGADGAAIGFALVAEYDSPSVAKTSHIAAIAGRILSINMDTLVDYVFRKWS